MRVADYIAYRIKKLNKHTFMFVGGGSMYLNDAVGKAGIRYICMHHEQALAMAAEAYARVTGNPSVCIVTTGPGGINALNGVAGAWLDSIPMMVISGQVRIPMMKTEKIRQIGDQEVPIVDIVRPVTKFAEVVKDPLDIGYLFDKALYIATHGRPGPVWLDVPLDVQSAEYVDQGNVWVSPQEKSPYYDILTKVAIDLRFTNKPVILAGNGIRIAQATDIFQKFLRKVDAPVALAVNAVDVLPTLHDQNIGTFGLLGHQSTNDTIQQASLLLVLGCRMHPRQTGYNFGEIGKNALKIMVDIDEEELNKSTFIPNVKVKMDVKEFLTRITYRIKEPFTYGLWMLHAYKQKPIPRDSTIIKALETIVAETIDKDYIVVSANGVIPTLLSRYLILKKNDRYIVNSGCGSMGYGLPAAIGAALASDKMVICFEGDGSLQLNIQELQTLKALKLNIKLFVINNGGYASIKATQDAYFKGRYVGRGPESGITFPRLHGLINAYGLYYIANDVSKAINHKGSVICEIFTNEEVPYKADYSWKLTR
jgi:acetolactate synthase-1/2/3 large subunit